MSSLIDASLTAADGAGGDTQPPAAGASAVVDPMIAAAEPLLEEARYPYPEP